MTVRVYESTDASAPVMSGTAGAMIGVLDACLVNGYGAKSAAGWSKAYSGTNLAAYRSGTGSNQFYLRIDDTGTTTCRAVGYETMSDVNTGTGDFPTAAQLAGGLYTHKSDAASSAARKWVLVATEKTFYLWIMQTLNTYPVAVGYRSWLCFGDFTSYKTGDAYNTFICSHTSSANSSCNFGDSGNVSSTYGAFYIARAHTNVSGAVASGAVTNSNRKNGAAAAQNKLSGTGGATYPDPVTGGVLINKTFLSEVSASSIRGELPGVWDICHTNQPPYGDTFSGSGSLSGKTFIVLPVSSSSSVYGCIAIETSNTW